jgi:hypothetical protein
LYQIDQTKRLLWLRLRASLLGVLDALVNKNATPPADLLDGARKLFAALFDTVDSDATTVSNQYDLLLQTLEACVVARRVFAGNVKSEQSADIVKQFETLAADRFAALIDATTLLLNADDSDVPPSRHIPALSLAVSLPLRWSIIGLQAAIGVAPGQKKVF